MRSIHVIVACLACTGYCRRVQTLFEQLSSSLDPSSQSTSEELRALLLALNSGVAPSVLGTQRLPLVSPSVVRMDAPGIDVAKAAQDALDNILNVLGDGVEGPESMGDVEKAIAGGDNLAIGDALYKMLVDQHLNYDMTKEGQMVPTIVDYSKTDDAEVKAKVGYVYSYGISMMKNGLIAQDKLIDTVLNRVATQVNMDGPALDKWLEIPAAI